MEADQNTSETAAEKKKGGNDHIFPLLTWSEWELVYIKLIALVTLHHISDGTNFRLFAFPTHI